MSDNDKAKSRAKTNRDADENGVLTIQVDPEDFTYGEVIEIEELSGQPFDALGDPSAPKGKMFAAMALITRKRVDPDFTWEQVLRARVDVSPDAIRKMEEGIHPTEHGG